MLPKLRFALVLLAVFASGMALSAQRPDDLSRISFVNQTGYDIRHLFYSPGDSDQWGPDILGSRGWLRDGEVLSFFVHHPERRNYFDFLAIDASGDAFGIPAVEVEEGRETFVSIGLEHFEQAGVDWPVAELVLTNTSSDDIWYLFISPSRSNIWGVDILDDETLFSRGDSLLVLLPVGDFVPAWDVLGLDENNGTLYRSIELAERGGNWFIDLGESDRK
jgi:hypothetical protein